MRATIFLLDSVSLPKYDIVEFQVGVFGEGGILLLAKTQILIQEEMLAPKILLPNLCKLSNMGQSLCINSRRESTFPPSLPEFSVDDEVQT